MLEKATALVASYDSLLLVAIAVIGILTATAWTLAKRGQAKSATKSASN